MKTITLASFFILIVSINGFGQEKCKEYATTPNNAVAFCPPAGWVGRQPPGEKFSVFANFTKEPTDEQLPISMIVVDRSAAPEQLEVAVFKMINSMFDPGKYTNMRLVDIRDFQTTSGLKGSKFIFQYDEGSRHLRQTSYYFAGPKNVKLLFIVNSMLADAAVDSVTDTAMKTVHIKE